MYVKLKHIWRTVRRSFTSGYYNLFEDATLCTSFAKEVLSHVSDNGREPPDSLLPSGYSNYKALVEIRYCDFKIGELWCCTCHVPCQPSTQGATSQHAWAKNPCLFFLFIRQNSNIKSSLMRCFEIENPTLGPVSL